MKDAICVDPGCDRRVETRDWCHRHYEFNRRTGRIRPLPVLTTEERFWAKVSESAIPSARPDLGPCWRWTGSTNEWGYGLFRPRGRGLMKAHRWAYEHLVGPIPDGLFLDHLCRNRPCVNPLHLEPVTNKENLARGIQPTYIHEWRRSKTHCPQGHPYSGDNLYIGKKGDRCCRTCQRAQCRRYGAKQRAAKAADRKLGGTA